MDGLALSGSPLARATRSALATPRQRRAPAAGRRPRPVRPPVITDQQHFFRVDGHLLRISVRGEGTPILLIMGLGGNIEMWAPLERELNAETAIGPSPTTPPAQATRRRASRHSARAGSPGKRRTSSTRSACQPSTSSASPSAAAWPKNSPSATRTGSAGWSSPRRCAGSAASRAPRSRLAVLATPLRYYSPRFLRATARWVYGPVHDTDGTLMRHQIVARRSRPRRCGATSASLRRDRLDQPPVAAPHHRTHPLLNGADDPVVPPVNARILAARIPTPPSTSSPTRATCSTERAPESAALITEFLHPDL